MGLSSPTYQIGTWVAGDTGLTLTDEFGTTFCVTSTSGVYDGAGVILSQSPIPNGDGAYRSDSNRDVATPVLSGWAKGSSVAGTIASRRAFIGLFPRGRQRIMTVTELDGSQFTMTVESNGNPKATLANGVEFDWQLSMVAADPNKYLPSVDSSTGLPTSSGGIDYTGGGHDGIDYTGGGNNGIDYGSAGVNGLIQLNNPGTDDAWPVLTIRGPTDGATLVNPSIVDTDTGDVLALTLTLNTGDKLVIVTNPHGRSVKLNGVPYRKYLTTAQFFSVPPGSSINIQFQGTSASNTSQMVASLASALQ